MKSVSISQSFIEDFCAGVHFSKVADSKNLKVHQELNMNSIAGITHGF